MNFLELAQSRYSCRKLTEKEVEQEKLDKIIEAARLAPTALNKQPFKLFVFKSEEARENIKKVTPFTYGASTFIVVGSKRDAAWTREFDSLNYADVDATIVTTHMLLQVEELGLGTTWVGYFDEGALKELYPQLKDFNLIALLPIGYKAEDAEPSSKHFRRRDAEILVETL